MTYFQPAPVVLVDQSGTPYSAQPSAATGPSQTEITDGTNGNVAVKAAGTAPVAADRSLVVALSPNGSLPAGTNSIGSVSASVASGQGSQYAATSTAAVLAANIKATPGSVYALNLANTGASTAYVKLYDLAAAPTVGTSVPVLTIPVASGALVNVQTGPVGQRFATGISISISGGLADTDATAPVAGVKVLATYA